MTDTNRKLLRVEGADPKNGNVILNLKADDGSLFEIPLSVFDVSTMTTMLNGVRAQALNQIPDKSPDSMLVIQNFGVGKNEDHHILRIYVGAGMYQDFAAPKGSDAGDDLQALEKHLATKYGLSPTPLGPRTKH